MRIEELLERLRGVRRSGDGWAALCPAHDDKNPSLSINERDGKILLHCHAGCALEAVCAAVGTESRGLFVNDSSKPQIVATYNYTDEQGKLLFQVVRREPKSFRQRRPNSNGGWVWDLKDVRRVLYNLPAVLEAELVLVCEGEKDCETARKLGFVATCNPGGVGKWRAKFSETLHGKRVCVIADADVPGRKHAKQVCDSLVFVARDVKLLELPGAKDLTEWAEHGGTREALLKLVRNAALSPAAGARPKTEKPQSGVSAAAEAARIAGLTVLDLEARAKRLEGMGTTREDTSNSERFAEDHKEKVRFWHGREKWLLWTVTHWADDQEAAVRELAKQTAKSIYAEAAELPDEEAKKMGKWAERSLNRDKVAAMLDLARSIPGIAITTDKLDRDPYALNCKNGTVNLKTGEMRKHLREDYITKLVRYDYLPERVSAEWSRFLERTFGDLADFVQKAVGYSLTGAPVEKVVFLLLGPTNTGKTTFLSTMREVFADYSAVLQIDTLMWGKTPDNNTSADLADLRGARLVITSETEENQRLREAKLKRITQGQGDIKTARKYENPITFPTTHSLWLDANHAPVVRGTDDAIWKRLVPIPCTNRLADAEMDKNLPAKLLEQAQGIVAWTVAGAVRYFTEGLERPEKVEAQRTAWRESMDIFGDFLADCFVIRDGDFATNSDMQAANKRWAEDHCYKPLGSKALSQKLIDRGFPDGKSYVDGKQVRGHHGLRVRGFFETETEKAR